MFPVAVLMVQCCDRAGGISAEAQTGPCQRIWRLQVDNNPSAIKDVS